MSDQARINGDELEWEDGVLVLNGAPYSGVAFSLFPDGSIKSEDTLENGLAEGVCRDWYPNGNLECEWFARQGVADVIKQWLPSGKVKSLGKYEAGVELEYTEWNEQGAVILQRRLNEESVLADYLRTIRKALG